MDTGNVHQKSPKQARGKKKPFKVVYISNPLKVKTSASKFKGLVQGLTGRYSDIADISDFSEIDLADGLSEVADQGFRSNDDDPGPVRPGRGVDTDGGLYKNVSAAAPLDMLDEAFTQIMLESFTGFVPSSSLCYEHQGDTFRPLDGV